MGFNMSEIYQIIKQLESTSSRLEKESILKKNRDNVILKQVFSATLNPFINYYIKKIPDYVAFEYPTFSLENAIDSLKVLSSRERTGNSGIAHLKMILENVTTFDVEIIKRIIDRDMKCGVDTKTVNKIWPGLIPTFDVCLSHKDISGIKFPAYAQTKMDGARCHVYWDGVQALAFSRNGKQFELHGALNDAASKIMITGQTWDGELLFRDPKTQKVLDRKTSNGLANKANKGTLSIEESKNVIFVAWDVVDFTSKIPYEDRISKVQSFGNIFKVPTVKVKTEEEAWEFYQEQIIDGQEGAILKNTDMIWEPKRVKSMGKMKQIEDADLIVVGWEEGTGKNIGKLGALVCETAEGKVKVNVGTGFSDEERLITDDYVGKVIAVQYNQLITDKKTGEYSLFLPRFIEVRNDKSVANKFGDLK
jgi:hypothetical protein